MGRNKKYTGNEVANMLSQVQEEHKRVLSASLKDLSPIKLNNFNEKMYNQMLISRDGVLCANRYKWTNLPINLTSQQLEMMFYKYKSLCFFVENDILKVTTYAKVGRLNPYGMLDKIQPIDFAGKTYKTVKTVINYDGQEVPEGEDVAVIIDDYTSLISDGGISDFSRLSINSQTTIKDQVNVYRQLAQNISLSVKKAIALCDNEEQKRVIMQQANQIIDPNVPIVPVVKGKKSNGMSESVPVEMWNWQNSFDTQNYCQQIDFYDKVRRIFNGIPAPDTFEKKERKVTAETENTDAHTDIVLDDGLFTRRYGLELIKKYFKDERIQKINVGLTDVLKPTDIKEERGGEDDDEL